MNSFAVGCHLVALSTYEHHKRQRGWLHACKTSERSCEAVMQDHLHQVHGSSECPSSLRAAKKVSKSKISHIEQIEAFNEAVSDWLSYEERLVIIITIFFFLQKQCLGRPQSALISGHLWPKNIQLIEVIGEDVQGTWRIASQPPYA